MIRFSLSGRICQPFKRRSATPIRWVLHRGLKPTATLGRRSATKPHQRSTIRVRSREGCRTPRRKRGPRASGLPRGLGLRQSSGALASAAKMGHGPDARPILEVEALHEPQRAAGILPAENAWLCRRDVGSTLPGGTSFRRFMVPIRAQNEWRLPMNLKMVLLISNGLRN